MKHYREVSEHERQLRDWLTHWASRRTLREVRHVLATVYLMQDENMPATAIVDQLFDGGTWIDIQERMTEAIAYVLSTPTLTPEWVQHLTTYHGDLEEMEQQVLPAGGGGGAIDREAFWAKLGELSKAILAEETNALDRLEQLDALSEVRGLARTPCPPPEELAEAIATSPFRGIRLRRLERVEGGPLWHGVGEDGRLYSIRYQVGHLRVLEMASEHDRMWLVQLGDTTEGTLDEGDMLHATGFGVDEATERA